MDVKRVIIDDAYMASLRRQMTPSIGIYVVIAAAASITGGALTQAGLKLANLTINTVARPLFNTSFSNHNENSNSNLPYIFTGALLCAVSLPLIFRYRLSQTLKNMEDSAQKIIAFEEAIKQEANALQLELQEARDVQREDRVIPAG